MAFQVNGSVFYFQIDIESAQCPFLFLNLELGHNLLCNLLVVTASPIRWSGGDGDQRQTEHKKSHG